MLVERGVNDREVKGKGEEKAKSSSRSAKAQPQNLTAIRRLASCGLAGRPMTEMWGKCCTDHLACIFNSCSMRVQCVQP